MKVLDFKSYRDGGTVEVHTDKGVFCFDHRINTKTPWGLYYGYPSKNEIIEDSIEIEKEILQALKVYEEPEHPRYGKFYEGNIKKTIEYLEGKIL